MRGLRPDIDERHSRSFRTCVRGEPMGWGIADRAAAPAKGILWCSLAAVKRAV